MAIGVTLNLSIPGNEESLYTYYALSMISFVPC